MPDALIERSDTFEATITTGAKVRRSGSRPDGSYGDWYEVLSIDGADLSRGVGAPLNLDHVLRGDLLVGVVERVAKERERITAELRFGKGARAQEMAGDVRDRIRRQLSIGYSVEEWSRASDRGADVPTFTATKWTLLEVSLVSLGADFGAQFPQSHLRLKASNDDGIRRLHDAGGRAAASL